MEDFKETNLIIYLNNSVYKLDNINGLVELIFGEKYSTLTNEEQFQERLKLLLPFSIEQKFSIVDSNKGIVKDVNIIENSKDYDKNSSFFIDDEITTFLSLCKIDQLQILEKVDADIFTKDMNKDNIEANYILVNKFAGEILDHIIKKN